MSKDLNDTTLVKTYKSYNLIVMDIDNLSINIYPDDIKLDIISKMKVQDFKETNMMIIYFNCIDKKENGCKARLFYQNNSPVLLDIYYNDHALFYFINKQKK